MKMGTPTDKSSAKVPIKPKDWPANDRERFLDAVVLLLEDFVSHPSYKTKDAIVALSCNYDYHQKLMLGMCRVTDYEVMLVNSIYKAAHHYFLFFLQSRLYEIVADVARMENCAWKCSLMLPGRETNIFRPIEAYAKLEKPLRLFYFAYQEYVCCKSELKFLCSIIDHFKMSAAKKQAFLKDILQYWLLSVKDPKWKNEKERRYIIFDHFGDEYLDVEVGKGFLKVRTDLLKNPNFIIPPHPLKAELNKYISNNMGGVVSAPCLYCENCLNRDYDTVVSRPKNLKCSICGSGRLRYIK